MVTTMSKDEIKARVDVRHPNLVMLGLYMGAFLGMLSETSMNIALPDLMKIFDVSVGIVQWLVVGYMLVIGIVLPFTSLLLKWIPARPLVVFPLTSFLLGSLICEFSTVFPMLLFGLMIQGISTGLILPIMFSVILEVFPLNKLGFAMGTSTLVVMFAPAIGPTLSGFLIATLSWRWIFFFFALLAFIALITAAKWMVNPYTLLRSKIDGLSCLTSVLGFGGVVLGVGLISEPGLLPLAVVSLIVGMVALGVYIYRQLHMTNPIIDLYVLGIKQFSVGAIIVMMNFSVTLVCMYILPQEIQGGLGIPVATAGMIMLPGGVVNALISLFAGRLYDSIGSRLLVFTGLILTLVGLILLIRVESGTSIAYLIFAHFVLMIGIPTTMSPAQSFALSALPARLSTDGSTVLNTLQQVLGAVMTAVATNLLSFGQSTYISSGRTNKSSAFINGSRYGFIFACVLALVALVAAFRIKAAGLGPNTPPRPAGEPV